MTDVRHVLRNVWGYDSFRPLQEQSIRTVLSGQDSLTVLPTGGGKSICFQVPALCTDGLAVVVSPLISLMKDQVDALNQYGVRASYVNSTQSDSEKRLVAQQIRDRELKLLYLAPERLLSPKTLEFLQQQHVSYFAIDEAHCVSQWGHDFRPEYRDLNALKQRFPKSSVHAFTATASEPVRRDITEQLGLHNAQSIVGSFDRPNLTYRMIRAGQKTKQIMDVAGRHAGESGIVYCISRREVDTTTKALCTLGLKARPYHAGMTDQQRQSSQDAFMQERCDVIVATIAFGMGIDKSNVRFVVHTGMPKSVEHYQQESGRAGRDGLEAECVLLHSPRDFLTWKDIMGGHGGQAAEQSLQAMYNLCNGIDCRHKSIVEYFGQEFKRKSCNACDVCFNELKLVPNPIPTSQTILRCVVDMKEKFGAGHAANVLAGKSHKRVSEHRHDDLDSFGGLSENGPMAIKVWIEQLISQRYLARHGKYKTLSLTQSGRELLRGLGNPKLTLPGNPGNKTSNHFAVSWQGVDRDLFDSLRRRRSQIAAQRSIPAYTVFGDATLREMARVRPSNLTGLGKIQGIGTRKLETFGKEFFDVIDSVCRAQNLERDAPSAPPSFVPSTGAMTAFEHFRAGDSIGDVARKLARAESTVVNYLTQYIRHHGISDPTTWVNPRDAAQILDNKHLAEKGAIKPLFDQLGGEVSYNDIKITLACDG
ncbi:MAG: DNA helicase RecQ [Planctomycetales bacterium]|nr:DNA helicase RecQ [Planctomycetales bacterium]